MAERKDFPIEDLPSNSFKSKEDSKKVVKEEKKVEKVVTGKVVRKKRSIGKRIVDAFTGDENEDVGQYILYDVLIPAFKSTLSDAVSGGLEMLLYGERRGGERTTRDRGRSYVSYQSYYDRRDDRREPRRASRNHKMGFDDVIFESRREAETVLNNMMDLIDVYGMASVADFYELVGIPSDYTDNKWGWENLAPAYVERTRSGWVLRMPRTVVID